MVPKSSRDPTREKTTNADSQTNGGTEGQTDAETNEMADMQTHTGLEMEICLHGSTAGGSVVPTFVRRHERARGTFQNKRAERRRTAPTSATRKDKPS